MERKMKKRMSLLMALSMSFSMFTLSVQASPGINTEMEQAEVSETTAADDNHAAAAETQSEETQSETGYGTYALRGGVSTFRLDAGDIDVSSVSAANVVPEDGTEVDDNSPMMIENTKPPAMLGRIV